MVMESLVAASLSTHKLDKSWGDFVFLFVLAMRFNYYTPNNLTRKISHRTSISLGCERIARTNSS